MNLIDNIYAYVWEGQDNNCNSYVIANAIHNQKHIIVDPGHIKTPSSKENAIQILLNKIGQDGLDPRDIGLVILTHGHPDHVESAMGIRAQLGAKIAIHKADFSTLQQFRGTSDIFLEEGDLNLVSDPETRLTVIHTPGHTRGHITLYIEASKTLIAGDLVFYKSTGRSDLPGGDPIQLKESILKISKLDIDYLLCGHPYGHSGVIEGKEEVQENFKFILERMV